MKLRTRSTPPMLLGLVFGLTGMALAQSDIGNEPKGINPPNWGKMPPAKRQEATKNMIAQVMRDSLKGISVTDEKNVTMVLQFAESQETAQQSVRKKSHTVRLGLIGHTDGASYDGCGPSYKPC